MIHPIFKLLVARPDLLAEHAGAYAQLAVAEAGELAQSLRARGLWLLAAGLAALLALGFSGVALMLAAALPAAQMPAPWGLWAVPGALWATALGCGLAARRCAVPQAMGQLRAQWAEDTRLLAEAGQSS